MDRAGLIAAISSKVPAQLATDLVDEFLALRQDVALGVLGRSPGGKFVETVVQILQHLESGKHDPKPAVDAYLRGLDTSTSTLDDGLRFCAARLARAMYTLRNKRNILHKGDIDPNTYDLRLLLNGAQWIMAELLRVTAGGVMQSAGKLVDQVQAPVGGLVEDFGDRRIVLSDLSARAEILVLLHSHYPELVSRSKVFSSLDRRSPKTVSNTLRDLWNEKAIESDGQGKQDYKLTQRGFREAVEILKEHV